MQWPSPNLNALFSKNPKPSSWNVSTVSSFTLFHQLYAPFLLLLLKKKYKGGGKKGGRMVRRVTVHTAKMALTPSSWLAPPELLLQGHLHYYCSVFLMTRQVLMHSHENSLLSSIVCIPSITTNNKERQADRLKPIAPRSLWNYKEHHLQFYILFPFQISIPNTWHTSTLNEFMH